MKEPTEVKSKTAKCLVLDRESFDILLGPLSDIIQGQRDNKKALPGTDGGDICRGKPLGSSSKPF